jgi:hypothetical protein
VSRWWTERRVLFLVVLVAAAVRVWGIGFGLPNVGARPDESQIAGPAVGFLSGDLRPPYLEWPTLFAYTVALLYAIYFLLTRPVSGYATLAAFAESRRVDIRPFIYITRGLSALLGVLTVWWTYALGRRAFGGASGLVAAWFLALAFLHVRDSHFGVTDVAVTGLAVLAVLAAVRWQQIGGWRAAALAGIAAGLATSTKYNGALVCAAFAVAVLQRAFEERSRPGAAIIRALQALAVFGGAAAAAFLATSPYVAIDWSRFVARARVTQSMLEHGHGMALGRGWIYFAAVVLPAAVGWPVYIAGVAGAALLLVARLRQSAVVLAFPLAYYLVAGQGHGVFARYILPMLPFVCLCAAWLTVETARRLTAARSTTARTALTVVFALALVAPSAYKTVLLDRLLATTDNRALTGRALLDIVRPGDLIYQTGERYGHVPLAFMDRRADVRNATFDHVRVRFRPREPEWILVQRSPLVLYSWRPASLAPVLRDRYVLVRSFPVEARSDIRRTYDQQDAFFIPLSGLEGLIRPGPAFDLYARRGDELPEAR